MKKICALILCIAMLCMTVPFGVLSASAETSGVYIYTVENGEATITDVDDSISGDVEIPSTLGGYPVTTIGYHAFYENNDIESLIVPESVTTIKSSAIQYLSNLKTVVIMNAYIDSNNFHGCRNLESITFGKGVSYIADNLGCYEKTSTIIVDEENEYYCSVNNVLFNKNKTTLIQCAPAKKGTYTIPDTVSEIGDGAFSSSQLTKVEIPESVITIGINAFQGTKLVSIEIPDSVIYNTYNWSPISNSTKLSYIKLGKGFTTIPVWFDTFCTSLKSLTLPESVTRIAPHAFKYGSLDKIVILNPECDIYDNYYGSSYDDGKLHGNFYGEDTIKANTVIYGYKDSTAQAYAEKFNREFVEIIPEFLTPEIDGVSITAGADMTVNYYSAYGAIADLRITMNDKEYYLNGTYDYESQMYVYSFKHIVPQKIGDTLKADLIVDGEVVAVKDGFSVKGYLEAVMGKTAADLGLSEDKYAKLVTLSKDILNYGAAAQKYYGYNEDALINEGVTGGTEFVAPTATDKDISECEANGFKFNGQNLRFDNVNRLMFRFELDPEKYTDIDSLKIKVDNGNESSYYYSGHLFSAGENTYLIYSDAIAATEFDEVYTVTAYYNDTKIAGVKYSVNSYIYAMCNKADIGENMLNLAKATYNYGISAEAYAAAN